MPEPNDIPIELHNWLRIATRELPPEERGRFRDGLFNLFQERICQEKEAGRTEQQALKDAIQALGDPWLAPQDLTHWVDKLYWDQPEESDRDAPPREFNNWIHDATLGHGPATRQWISDRAEASYREHFARGLAAGLSPTQARDAGIRALGDPKKVRSSPDQIESANRWLAPGDMLKPIKDYLRRCRTPQARTLEAWLEIATYDLGAEARTRVRQEIEAHYQDARATLLEARRSEGQAECEALAGLGSPWVAARRFAKSYLSHWDLLQLALLRDLRHPIRSSITRLVMETLAIDVCYLLPWFVPVNFFLFFYIPLRIMFYCLLFRGKAYCDTIKAHYLLATETPGGERRLRSALLGSWSFLVLNWTIISIIAHLTFEKGKYSVTMDCIITLSCIVLIICFIWVDLKYSLTLMRKLKDQDRFSNHQGPDQYA